MSSDQEFRMAWPDRIFLGGVTLMVTSTMGLVTVLVSWALGGAEFKDSIFGDHALLVFLGGFLAGVALVARSRRLPR